MLAVLGNICLTQHVSRSDPNTVDYCHEVNCNSGYCVRHAHSYECACLEGFEGEHCELQHCTDDVT